MQLTRKEIEQFLEKDLVQRVLLPLFEAMGFQEVRDTGGGSQEQGKDIVMWRSEAPRDRVNYGVVVKADRITGDTSIGTVLTQIKQCLGSDYIDPKTHETQRIHHCFVVSSQTIKKEGTNSLHSLLVNDRLEPSVTLLDGDELWRNVERYLITYLSFGRLREGYENLPNPGNGYQLAVTLLGNETKVTVTRKDPSIEPMTIGLDPVFPETPEGVAKREAYERFRRTGEPVELAGENINREGLPEFLRSVLPERDFTVSVGPESGGKPLEVSLTLVEPNTGEVIFEHPYVRFDAPRAGSEAVSLSNESQDSPLRVQMSYRRTDRRGKFELSVEARGSTAYWLEQAVRMQRALVKGCEIRIRDLKTGLVFAVGDVEKGGGEESEAEFAKLVHALAMIQDRLHVAIRIPNRPIFTGADRAQILRIAGVLSKGEELVSSETMVLKTSMKRAGVRELLAFAESDKKIVVGVSQEVCVVRLLDQEVSLGPYLAEYESPRIHPDDLGEVMRRLDDGGSDDIEARIVPSGGLVRAEYLAWKKHGSTGNGNEREDTDHSSGA